jgi:hypothetical protein
MDSLIIVAILMVLAGPVLGIIALVAVRRLEGEAQTGLISQLTSRIFDSRAENSRTTESPELAAP